MGLPDHEFARRISQFFFDIFLIFVAVFLFGLSFPGAIIERGLFPLAYAALFPVFILIRRSNWYAIAPYGLLYGFFAYAFFNYWLFNFHPLAIYIVPAIYGVYFAALFLALKAAHVIFPRYGYLLQIALWIGYELLRTKGYLGYSYGIMGYSQYLFLPIIQIASLFGVWIVSIIVIFPSALAATIAENAKKLDHRRAVKWKAIARPYRWEIAGYGLAIIGALIYGLFAMVDYSESETKRFALVQHNVDPWEGGVVAYTASLDALIRQSDIALQSNPDIVVWSETAFVPAIDYHRRHRRDAESYDLVRRLDQYLKKQTIPFVFGNDDGQLKRNGSGELERIDYNAVILYKNGDYGPIYRKTHLVPFSEHFPYRRQFPWLYRLLIEHDTNFWEAGDEYTVFNAAGIAFSSPICFEDTFGYISRRFINEGAEIIVNLSNDSWSRSTPAAIQHMAMAVFRAIENRRSVARSTNGGLTAVIDPNGKILAQLPTFVENNLIYDIPIYTDTDTLYTKYGDWLAWAVLCGGAIALAIGIPIRLYRLIKSARGGTPLRASR